eukprot:SAG11_NODE_10938_length_794_cov_3.533813_1_plen_29_part_10
MAARFEVRWPKVRAAEVLRLEQMAAAAQA